jgi:hypothetical protein
MSNRGILSHVMSLTDRKSLAYSSMSIGEHKFLIVSSLEECPHQPRWAHKNYAVVESI